MSKTSRERRKAERRKLHESHVVNVHERIKVIAEAHDTPVFVCKRCGVGSMKRPARDRCPQCNQPIMVLPRGALPTPEEKTP